jgi:hypothetical protein
MCARKSDAPKFEEYLKDLSEQDWLKRSARSWWTKYLFHFTDITNAVKILECGELKCRKILEDSEKIETNSASPVIIQRTGEEVKNYVRLYFRPQTPTQFHNEGVKPPNCFTDLKAHCPIPVFLLFNSLETLTLSETKFSNGNLATDYAQIGDDVNFIRQLPMKKIYHVGTIRSSEREIMFHRNAEVIVPKNLNLNGLRHIVCRSQAEKETLLYLLPNSDIWDKWSDKIILIRNPLFFKRWTFLKEVNLFDDYIYAKFSPDSETPGPFQFKACVSGVHSDIERNLINDSFIAHQSIRLNLPNDIGDYEITMYLDNNLIYSNMYIKTDMAF